MRASYLCTCTQFIPHPIPLRYEPDTYHTVMLQQTSSNYVFINIKYFLSIRKEYTRSILIILFSQIFRLLAVAIINDNDCEAKTNLHSQFNKNKEAISFCSFRLGWFSFMCKASAIVLRSWLVRLFIRFVLSFPKKSTVITLTFRYMLS